jgi:hypothetical protein
LKKLYKTYSNKSLIKTILIAGLIAGTLDAAAATIKYYINTGNGPVRIFVFIASGIFGNEAYEGSQSIAIFGLIFHYLTAIIFSAFYFLIYPKIEFLHNNKLFSAFLYGIFVWLIMNLIVVPLSNTPALTFHITDALIAAFILIICIGIPVCFMAASFYKKNISV